MCVFIQRYMISGVRRAAPSHSRNTTTSRSQCCNTLLDHPPIRVSIQLQAKYIPSLVLGFWDKNTMVCAGAMLFRPGIYGHYQDIELST